MELGVTERLPEVWKAPEGRPLGKPAPPPRRTRGGGDAFRDFIGRLFEYEKLHPVLEEWEVRYAAIGAAACLAVAAVSTALPNPASVAKGNFDVLGLATQEITFLKDWLEVLVSVIRGAMWPLIVAGVVGLALDAYFAVRPRQPISWHYVCAGQMLLGFLAGLALVAIFGIVLANIAVGLLAAAVVVMVGVIVLGIVLAILGGVVRL
jgi:hypothetical protein